MTVGLRGFCTLSGNCSGVLCLLREVPSNVLAVVQERIAGDSMDVTACDT